jgi:hypothetical protein
MYTYIELVIMCFIALFCDVTAEDANMHSNSGYLSLLNIAEWILCEF